MIIISETILKILYAALLNDNYYFNSNFASASNIFEPEDDPQMS